MWRNAIKSITNYYFFIPVRDERRGVLPSSTKPATKRNNRSSCVATISGRARASASRTGIKAQLPPARHGTSPSAGGHVFTIVRQPTNVGRMTDEGWRNPERMFSPRTDAYPARRKPRLAAAPRFAGTRDRIRAVDRLGRNLERRVAKKGRRRGIRSARHHG